MWYLLAQLSNLKTILPWVSFIAGIGGSLHCVGMCGGLVTATCQKSNEVVRYQFGRLLGYLILGFFAGMLGKIFTIQADNPKLTLIPGLLIGLLFLFWGIQNYRGKKAEIPLPKFLNRLYTHLWMRYVQKNTTITKSFITGLLSIFLPCGLLYGVVLGVAAFEHSFYALFAMFFFWLGTVPSMILAPTIVQKFLRPFKSKLPKTYAISLIIIGLMTITFRVSRFQEVNAANVIDNKQDSKLNCH
ncbi:MAG: sulfite exporter TauE/SafE family protein [Alphaproteobacteria bacterium]|nr:MAG: sulfite exporter TauE/SafE family protein [Alphaproteobacteria bacterium]